MTIWHGWIPKLHLEMHQLLQPAKNATTHLAPSQDFISSVTQQPIFRMLGQRSGMHNHYGWHFSHSFRFIYQILIIFCQNRQYLADSLHIFTVHQQNTLKTKPEKALVLDTLCSFAVYNVFIMFFSLGNEATPHRIK